jgi:hypothetical protein
MNVLNRVMIFLMVKRTAKAFCITSRAISIQEIGLTTQSLDMVNFIGKMARDLRENSRMEI